LLSFADNENTACIVFLDLSMAKPNLTWLTLERNLIGVNFAAGWNWTDFHEVNMDMYKLVRQINHDVWCFEIAFGSAAHRLPAGSPFMAIRSLGRFRPPNLHGVSIVGDGMIAMQTVSIVKKMNLLKDLELDTAPTLEEAFRRLGKKNPTVKFTPPVD
jgi:hypothetical protein